VAQDCALNDLDLNVDGGSKPHCFGFPSLGRAGLGLGLRLAGTGPRWVEDLAPESWGNPSSPGGVVLTCPHRSRDHQDGRECICAAACGALEAVLYLLTQKRSDMRAVT